MPIGRAVRAPSTQIARIITWFLTIIMNTVLIIWQSRTSYNVHFRVSKWLLLLIYEMWNVLNLSISLCSKWERRIIWQWSWDIDGLITDRVVHFCCQISKFRNIWQDLSKILPAHWLEDRDDYIENAGLIIMTMTIIIIVTRAVLLHCFGDIGCMIACKD